MDILKEIGIKHNINMKRLFNNPKVNFFIVANLVLFIGCYNFLDNSLKNGLTTFLSYPLVLFILSSVCLLVGYYNMVLGIILIVALFTILYPNVDTSIEKQVNTNTSEGFTTREDYQDRRRRRERVDAEDARKEYRNKNIAKDMQNNVSEMFNELKEEYEDDLRQGMKENLLNILSSKRRSNKQNFENVNTNNTKKTEKFTDDYETELLSRERKRENFRTIKKRKFNPNDENDANFLICKEILKDLLNRITYQYESKEYLKKYIEHRIEEMIDLFKFGQEEESV